MLLVGRTIIDQDGRETAHPLDFRFQNGTIRADAARLPQAIQLSVHECLIRGKEARSARFPEDREAPTFEDALYLGRIRARNQRITCVPAAVYHYEKRSSGDSAVQAAWSRPGRYTTQFRTRYHPYLDVTGAAAWAQQTILYDLGWYAGTVDRGQMPTEPEGLGAEHAGLMRELVRRLDPRQILRSPWGHLSAGARARMLLWHDAPEVAIVRDGAVVQLYTPDARTWDAEPVDYAGVPVGYRVTGQDAERLYSGGEAPRVPVWPRRPRLAP